MKTTRPTPKNETEDNTDEEPAADTKTNNPTYPPYIHKCAQEAKREEETQEPQREGPYQAHTEETGVSGCRIQQTCKEVIVEFSDSTVDTFLETPPTHIQ